MEENGEEEKGTCVWMLPDGCIEEILALTTPLDACRVSLVAKFLQSAAKSDSLWEKLLPGDYQDIIANATSPIPDCRSKKDLFAFLCLNYVLLDGGRKSFSLDKNTGKKCYLLGARDLHISWGDSAYMWTWTSLPESRFPEVAMLDLVCWLEIRGRIRAALLSPLTVYEAFLVYNFREKIGFDYRPSQVFIKISDVESESCYAFLDPDIDTDCQPCDTEEDRHYKPPSNKGHIEYYWRLDHSFTYCDIRLPRPRDDAWFEVKLGEFFVGNEDDCIEFGLHETKAGNGKTGLVVEGIEIRPKMS